jgi:hypothetical protein
MALDSGILAGMTRLFAKTRIAVGSVSRLRFLAPAASRRRSQAGSNSRQKSGLWDFAW